jgi:hypothetical protein
VTVAHIEIYEETVRSLSKNGKLDEKEVADAKTHGACERPALNYFERMQYVDNSEAAAALLILVNLLKQKPAGAAIGASPSLEQLRTVIREVRNDPTVKSNLKLLPADFSDQVTPDLLRALSPRRPRPTGITTPPTGAPPAATPPAVPSPAPTAPKQ